MVSLRQLRLDTGVEITERETLRRMLERCGARAWTDDWADDLAHLAARAMAAHGNAGVWRGVLDNLPHVTIARRELNRAAVTVATDDRFDRATVAAELKQLSPWRKGPYDLHGIHLDAEWRSDWKWARLAGRIAPLRGRRVLDVGCNNGYYLWRMLGAGAAGAIGVDPSPLYFAQFQALLHFIGADLPARVLPVGIEALPQQPLFDTVFSMGVLYHRKDPLAHLRQLRGLLAPGGELALETLIIEDTAARVLRPQTRYAKMRNVHAIPSIPQLARWLAKAGFGGFKTLDITRTTVDEQRATAWMPFASLRDFLDPTDPAKTIEGYPAPLRALLLVSG